MIAFNEDEVRPCATCGSTTCGHLAHDARVCTSSELAQVRTQINPPPIQPAPSAPSNRGIAAEEK
jgi:hypothetical protein